MFTKKPDSDAEMTDITEDADKTEAKPVETRSQLTPRTPPSHDPVSTGPSLIGEDLTVMGNIVSKGEVHVEGEIQGDINCVSLIVGEKAQVNGGINADDVIVRGRVEGTINGARLSLQSTSHVEGDIVHKSLVIEQGAYFEGKSRREGAAGQSSASESRSGGKSGSGSSSKSSSSSRAAE